MRLPFPLQSARQAYQGDSSSWRTLTIVKFDNVNSELYTYDWKDCVKYFRRKIDNSSPSSRSLAFTMLHSPTLLAGLTICIALKAYRIISTDAAKTTCQVLAIAVYGGLLKG
jgi:hypothetical protein